jgi:FkbM family methyltransferase
MIKLVRQEAQVVRKLVQSTLKKFGYRLVRDVPASEVSHHAPTYGLETFLGLLKRYGFNPEHVVDVGANKGTWTRRAVQFFPDAQYTLVEPQDHLKIHIQDLVESGCKISWINAGVSDTPGILPFTISYRDDSSTFLSLPENGDAPKLLVPVKTLNDIVSSSGAPLPGMVKIDAEGLDLKVVAGASDLFGKTEIFFVEVVICRHHPYENTIAKVVQKMEQAGYQVVDITDINRSPKYGVLWLCELAFLKNGSRLFESTTSYE